MAQLDTTQLETLRTDITVTNAATMWLNQTLLDWWNANEYIVISEYYAQEANPLVSLWRPNITNTEMSEVLDWTEMLTLSDSDLQVYALLINGPEVLINATLSNIRDGFAQIFSGPQRANSLNAITVLSQRPGSFGEVIYVGSIQSGAFVSEIFGEIISGVNVRDADQLP